MRVCLVGAGLAENMGLGLLAGAVLEAGHSVEVLLLTAPWQIEQLARSILEERPQLVGLSIQFQHCASDFLVLARRLREAGYCGHLTCGGHCPTAAWRELLEGCWELDSVVLHEGEDTLVELLAALDAGRSLSEVQGLALRSPAGWPERTVARAPRADLDELPWPHRYRPHAHHVGIPAIPILGSRGCWGGCDHCSVTAFSRKVEAVRYRSPQSLAEEMIALRNGAGGSAIFCFHDDCLLLQRPQDTVLRLGTVQEHMAARSMGLAAFTGTCRADALTPELARDLRSLGVLHLDVDGLSMAWASGGPLARRVRLRQLHWALASCAAAGIYCSYQLPLFEPEITLQEMIEYVTFIRTHAAHPVTLVRLEPYCATLLERSLASAGSLTGTYLDRGYRIGEERAEALHSIYAAAAEEGPAALNSAHSRYLDLGYYINILDYFYDDPGGLAPLAGKAHGLACTISLQMADFIDEAIAIAEHRDRSRSRVEYQTRLLAGRFAATRHQQHAELDRLYAMVHSFAAHVPRRDRLHSRLKPVRRPPRCAELTVEGP